MNKAYRTEHGAVPVEHDESSILLGEPAKGRERNHSFGTNYNETPKSMPNPR
jgi:hypothetical protein